MTTDSPPTNGTTPHPPELDPSLNHYAVGRVRIDLSGGNVVAVMLPAGARIVHSYTAYEAGPRLIARPGQPPPLIAVPMLVVLYDPRSQRQQREFVAIPVGSAVSTSKSLEAVATFGTENGEMFTLFEAFDLADVMAALRPPRA